MCTTVEQVFEHCKALTEQMFEHPIASPQASTPGQ
jgi:hypothetical protein